MSIRIVTDLSKEFNPITKPQHKRGKPKRGNATKITTAVRKEVLRRVSELHGYPVCERCGVSRAYSFEMAHLQQASSGGRGSDPANIAYLCGPSVNSNTCHNIADYTEQGREWRKAKRIELQLYYKERGWNG